MKSRFPQNPELLIIDSRKVTKDSAFFCLVGEKHDGHDSIEAAMKQGAALVVVDQNSLKAKDWLKNPKIFATDDVSRELGFAFSDAFQRPSDHLKIFGVTGTNGKTTSSYLLESILAAAGETVGVVGTIEYRLGGKKLEATHTTPNSPELQRLFYDWKASGATAIAMEVSSHGLQQWRTAGTRFQSVLFTNLTQDHLDYHPTMEDYFLAKRRLFFDYPTTSRILNGDDAYGKRLMDELRSQKLQVSVFGKHAGDLKWGGLEFSSKGISGELTGKTSIPVRSNLIGEFNAQNIAGVALATLEAGVSITAISKGISNLKAVPGRMELVTNAKERMAVVDYAHTPDALENVLKTLRPLCRGKLWVVFGCGGDRDPKKRPIMGSIASRLADFTVVTSDNPRTEDPEKILNQIVAGMPTKPTALFLLRQDAIAHALTKMQKDDCVLIAGKGHETYQILGDQKIPFDDRELVRDILGHALLDPLPPS